MPIFQPSVLKHYVAGLDKNDLTAAWKTFQAHFHDAAKQQNIRAAKEEQYQEGFLRDLFVDVLGYTLNPQPGYNLTTEYKNEKDSKKTDGAILLNGAVRAVIELKGTDTTDLSKIEGQAFGYLNNQKGCTYVITANFEKLRFYIQDATDHIEFNLFTLTKDGFDLLYLCLHRSSLLADVPLQVKQQSLTQEDAVTKKLYADYSAFKQTLYQNLVALNPQHNKLELFKKTQKLLDRFLFIFFAEDRLLLPPNSIRQILDQWSQLKELDNYVPLYDRFKKYFGYLHTGHQTPRYEIFAYNGGLFEPDAMLDGLTIDDDILHRHTTVLSKYNYETEVDVNILGHIFEHSLNEIEEIQASLANAAIDKTKTRRKKEGVFYTPRYITKYIVENTVGALCKEKKAALQIVEEDYAPAVKKTKASEAQRKTLVQKLDDYRDWLLALTICDPACGSGAFLNAALEFLIAEHSYVDELTNKLMGSGTLEFKWTPNDILEHNLFGVDINEEAVEIARLSLWLRTAQKGRKLSNLSGNIKAGNSLIDDKEVAGEKAFVWKEEFKEVFEKGGFDVVIGNPPYVFAREKVSEADKTYYAKTYHSAQYQVNTYLLFIEQSIKLLTENGKYGLIVPNAWLMVSSARNLREFVLKNSSINEIVNLAGYSFENVNVETIIVIGMLRFEHNQIFKIKENKGYEFIETNAKKQNVILNDADFGLKVFADNSSDIMAAKLRFNAEELYNTIQKLDSLVYSKVGNPFGATQSHQRLTEWMEATGESEVMRVMMETGKHFIQQFTEANPDLHSEDSLGFVTSQSL
ncbi:MAG: restriction endonuclease subunit M, partial [Chitinophagaceae bacterium]